MRQLLTILPKKSGRSKGRVTVRHQGGRAKRFLREIDFRRDKRGVQGLVEVVEYDPNRTANIARVLYTDGERRYILSPLGLAVGQKIIAGENANLSPGNALPLSLIPVGTYVHNIEIKPGKGGEIVRSAGSSAIVFAKEGRWVLIKLPSRQIRKFRGECYAVIGQIGNPEIKSRKLGKAGRKRRMGIRPTVRGTAQNPRSHPHGGGEGRSGVGMKYQKTPWGKPAVGKTRKKKKYSDKLIVKGANL
ncbi:50S ribosomal protein L2 [Candidatus Woesebacteria bacterium]|nr:50S ribosomal protein L2 [Candidatus Woesebacteria bacterium]